MSFLPIAQRELKIRSQRRSTWILRCVAVVVAVVPAVGMLLVHRLSAGGPGLGGAMFQTMAWMAFGFALIEGGRITADCLSEEKREGTLGLLFLTDLKGYDVVLGKLVSVSLNSFYSLIAVLPLLALPLLVGGVTPGEWWRVVLALLNALFVAVCVGMLASSASRRQGAAWASTFGLLVMLVVGLPVLAVAADGLGALAGSLARTGGTPFHRGLGWLGSDRLLQVVGALLRGLSPSTPILTAADAAYLRQAGHYWQALAGCHGAGWFALVLASFLLPRTWQDQPISAQTSADSGTRKDARRIERNTRREARRKAMLEENPFLWLALRRYGAVLPNWAVFCVLIGVAVVLAGAIDSELLFLGGMVFGLVGLLLQLWMVIQACRPLSEARTSGALELLVTTPMTCRNILGGQIQALKRLFFWPVVALGIAQGMFMGAPMLFLGSTSQWLTRGWIGGAAVLAAATVIVQFYALAYFGMWMALTARKASSAAGLTILLAIFLPKLLFCVPSILIYVVMAFLAKSQLEGRLKALTGENRRAGSSGNLPSVPPVLR